MLLESDSIKKNEYASTSRNITTYTPTDWTALAPANKMATSSRVLV